MVMTETILHVDVARDLNQRRQLPALFMLAEAVTMGMIFVVFYFLKLFDAPVYWTISGFVLLSGVAFIAVAFVLWRNTSATLALSQETRGREVILDAEELQLSVGLLAGPSLQQTRRRGQSYLCLPYERIQAIKVGPVFQSSSKAQYYVIQTYQNEAVYINPRPFRLADQETAFFEALTRYSGKPVVGDTQA